MPLARHYNKIIIVYTAPFMGLYSFFQLHKQIVLRSVVLLACSLLQLPVFAQVDSAVVVKDTTSAQGPKKAFNEWNTRFTSIHIGLGYIGDYVTYKQSDNFKQQMDSAKLNLEPIFKTRDFRFFFNGRLKTNRELIWKLAFMYDGNQEEWLVRETGLSIGVPELFGHIFLGRTKEGFSMVKVMNGHSPWTAERQMALDVIPILADGIKWTGHIDGPNVFWNLGYFNDFFSEGHGFSTHASQYVARVGYLPVYNREQNKVLHVAGNYRYGYPLDDKIVLKSRPESNPTPQIINTGTFVAERALNLGMEVYYSNGRLLAGSEVMVHKYYSSKEDHQFFGGDLVLAYLIKGGIRPYKTDGSIFGFVNVQKPVTKGGWGAWEGVLRYSNLNLNDGTIKGGQFWRITPMVNWYMTQQVRLEFIYGYGVLDRYSLMGPVHFFQTRLQLTVF